MIKGKYLTKSGIIRLVYIIMQPVADPGFSVGGVDP